VLFILPNTAGRSRLGVTLSRKVGNAVVRNRARRLIREIFRAQQEVREAGLDIVVHTKPEIAGASLDELRREFDRAMSRFREKKGTS
jgi:ribonuclease P protein component